MAKRESLSLNQRELHALEVWQRYVAGLPFPPLGWLDLAEAVVARTRPKRQRDETLAVALLVLDVVHGVAGLRDGGWIALVSAHLYTHFDGRGWGDARTERLCEVIVDVAWERGLVSDWDRTVLLDVVDRQREANGGRPKRARVIDPARAPSCLDELAERFTLATGGRTNASLARKVLGLSESFIASEIGFLRFGRLDAAAFALFLHEAGRGEARDEAARRDANRAILFMVAAFYRWLGASEQLSPARADEIAEQLTAHALSAASDLVVA